MQFGRKKKTYLFVVTIFGVIGALFGTYSAIGTFDSTRSQIQSFYDTEFDSCKVVSVIERKYPGRGNYSLFKTDCAKEFFPILLENMTKTTKSYFDKDVIIHKEPRDYYFSLCIQDRVYKLEVRHIENEKDGWELNLILISIFTLIILLILLLTPNKIFERGYWIKLE